MKVDTVIYDLLEDPRRVELEINVKDTGQGISNEDKKNLF